MDTRALWAEAQADKLLEEDWRSPTTPLSATGRADLCHLVEALQQCGLQFGLTQASLIGIPRGLQPLSPERVADMLGQAIPARKRVFQAQKAPEGTLFVSGQDIANAPLTSLRDLRILDAFYGTGNREGFAHVPLAAALDHLMACGLRFALGRSEHAPAATSVYEACRRFEGGHSEHDYSTLHFVSGGGDIVGKEFYEKSVSEAAFFEHGAAPEVMGEKAKAARVMRELANRGAIFHATSHSWMKEKDAHVVSPRKAWEELTSYEPGNVYVSMPGHEQLASFGLNNPEYHVHSLVIEPLVRNGAMPPEQAHELLASFSDAPLSPQQGGRLVGDLLHKIGSNPPRRAWVFNTDRYRMASWGYEVTAAALQQAPALGQHMDAWLDYVVAVGPYDAKEKFPAMHERANASGQDWHTEMALQIAEATLGKPFSVNPEVEVPGPHTMFKSVRLCWERDQAQPLLARLLERRLPASDRILRAIDDYICIDEHRLADESLAAAGERFQQVETLMRRYPEDDVRASYIAATRAAAQRAWEDCLQDITSDVSLGSNGHTVRRSLEREGAAPTMHVGEKELVINGVRIGRRA